MRKTIAEHSRVFRAAARIPRVALPILGAAIFLTAPHLADYAYRLVGGAMVLEGMNLGLQGWRTKDYLYRNSKLLACAVATLTLGLLFLLKQGQSVTVLGTIWGVVSMLQAVELMNECFFRLANRGQWGIVLLEAAVEFGLAVLLLWDPQAAFASHIRILGIQVFLSAFLPKQSYMQTS